jgi:hypothetical protein
VSLLPQPPYLGIRCHGPNVTTCRRVGVAVWVADGTDRVVAVVDGRRIVLRRPKQAGGYWEGLVTFPAGGLGLPPRWYGSSPSKWLRLRLTITRGARAIQRTLRVQLHPGWG